MTEQPTLSCPHPIVRARRRAVPLALVLALCGLLVAGFLAPGRAAAAPQGKERISLSAKEAGTGGKVTVTGKGFRPGALLTLLICGQNAIGGTNSCANQQGRAVTTDKQGGFSKKLPVAEPPAACPCVVRAATVTGAYADADAKFQVAGHPVKPLPRDAGGGRLTVLAARLEGESGLLTWFGAAPSRQLVLTVGNVGSTPARDPVFDIGTSHGVYSPDWEQQQWRGTVDPGRKAQVKLPVELSAGAHGDYTVAAKYSGKVLTEQPWEVGRPWGVTLFWVLLCVVVPAAVFRAGMAVVDRLRPRRPGQIVTGEPRPGSERPRGRARTGFGRGKSSGAREHPVRGGESSPSGGGALPWFTPDTLDAAPRTRRTGAGESGEGRTTISAPSDDRPTSKGNT
ncbi:neocarzinostatin apoprotein domain-containing protein [Streptomyces sp. ODS28]|uniref:neocarzinostatin apoprotein domain-containing protein n=1 Tax=Streptomyces sp. ODS28 TaxID=3136688 RepID=UPI0031ECC9EF